MQHHIFKGCLPQILLGPFLNTLSHLFNYFCTSGDSVFLHAVSLTLKVKLTYLIHLKAQNIEEARLRLWWYLSLMLKKLSSTFIANILSICIFTGLEYFKDKDIQCSFFIFKCFLLNTIFAVLVITIIAIAVMVVIAIFILIYFCFYYCH